MAALRAEPSLPPLCAASGEAELRARDPALNPLLIWTAAGDPESLKPGKDPDTIAGLQDRVCPALSGLYTVLPSKIPGNGTEPFRPGRVQEVCWRRSV